MQYRRLTTALIATLVLFTVSCRSSKTVTQQTHNETVHDTLIETVTLTLHDTIRETTTITIQTNETGDTTRLTTNRDRDKITFRDRTATTFNHQTTQTSTEKQTEATTSPIKPISPIKPTLSLKPLLISFLLGLLIIPLMKLINRFNK